MSTNAVGALARLDALSREDCRDIIQDVQLGVGPASDWLVSQTPVIEGWKAEDAAYASYCNNRDMGIKPDALRRFYNVHWAESFEQRYAAERRLG